jgi:predicted transposase YbfD/YdcC
MSATLEFLDFFTDLEDPRLDRRKLHPMPEILLLTLCGVIAGCEGWADIEDFGESKLAFLRKYLPYENGIPSDDTLRRFFRAIDPKSFEKQFTTWVKSLDLPGETLIAIDGKTARRSYDADNQPLHLVSAFASEARLVLGQVKVSEKSNEIIAIPELLNWLDIRGSTVTIDAMGCQREIAKLIREKGGDYVLALKGNQGHLYEDVRTFFEGMSSDEWDTAKTIDGEHGRIEERYCYTTGNIEWLTSKYLWEGLNSIGCIESIREEKGVRTLEKRYYISSLKPEATRLLKSVRSHWRIENSLHWVLDMSFGEDQSRIRKGNAPENMAIIRHFSLNLLQKYKKGRQSIRRLRKKAGWDNETLEGILGCSS